MSDAARCIQALRAGAEVADDEFDAMLPDAVRGLSLVHFTPVAVARQAARLLVTSPGARILDVGAGAGKFCLIAALTTRGSFTGIERNAQLVGAARHLARSRKVQRVHFLHGDVLDIDFRGYDGYYFFNPFVATGQEGLGLSPARRVACLEAVQARLAMCPPGTRVVTYHGFGGDMPSTYRRAWIHPCGSDVLELWIQDSPTTTSWKRHSPSCA